MTLRREQPQRGAILVEFALVALVMYLVLAAILALGRLLHSAQVVQDAARVAARELALTALPPDVTFDEVFTDPQYRHLVRDRIYDPDHLVVDLDAVPDLDAHFASLPVVNRALRPAMVFDAVEVGGSVRRLLRYPGALVRSQTAPSGFTVAIPKVVARDAGGAETIVWLPVLQEMRRDPADPRTGPFSLLSPAEPNGTVEVRINYPFQSGVLSGFRSDPLGPFEPNAGRPLGANDDAVTELGPGPGGPLAAPVPLVSPVYAGPYGLGSQAALGREVRPFRRLLFGQAIFQRELFVSR